MKHSQVHFLRHQQEGRQERRKRETEGREDGHNDQLEGRQEGIQKETEGRQDGHDYQQERRQEGSQKEAEGRQKKKQGDKTETVTQKKGDKRRTHEPECKHVPYAQMTLL